VLDPATPESGSAASAASQHGMPQASAVTNNAALNREFVEK
jgi:hypothetical protein